MNAFQQAWQHAQKSIFRLEQLPEYRDDWERFQQYLEGKKHADKDVAEWQLLLKESAQRGIKHTRVRVATKPLNDYIRYEIDFWKGMKEQETLFVDEKKYASLVEERKDYWLFDNKLLILFHYKDGKWDHQEIVMDQATIEYYQQLTTKLLNAAMPLNKFLE